MKQSVREDSYIGPYIGLIHWVIHWTRTSPLWWCDGETCSFYINDHQNEPPPWLWILCLTVIWFLIGPTGGCSNLTLDVLGMLGNKMSRSAASWGARDRKNRSNTNWTNRNISKYCWWHMPHLSLMCVRYILHQAASVILPPRVLSP